MTGKSRGGSSSTIRELTLRINPGYSSNDRWSREWKSSRVMLGQVVSAPTRRHRVGLQVRHAAVGDAVQLGVTALLEARELGNR